MPIPKAADLFGDAASPVEMAERFESYKAALNKSAAHPVTPGPAGAPLSEVAQLQKSLGSDEISKALSPELLSSVRESLAQADIGKELLAGPGGALGGTGGLQQYDLEAPAKLLAPRPTPLRNKIARKKGVGTAHQFKRITGYTGTGTGGVGVTRPGITETGTTTWGGQTLRRPQAITYNGDQSSVPYIEFGASDSVSWAAQYSGMGYQDIRQLSQSSVLYSSMLQEERLLLGGRGTVGSFAGALAAPTGTIIAPIAVVGSTGYAPITGYGTNIYVRVTSESVFGSSVCTAPVVVTAAANSYISVSGAVLPQGATGIQVYVGTGSSDPGVAGSFYAGRASNGNGFIIQGALPIANANNTNVAPAADNSATATEYDGVLTYCTGQNSGYVKNISNVTGANSVVGALSANPGNEFNVAFASLFDSVKASPDMILANGNDRKQLSDLLKTSSSSNYRINLMNDGDAHGAQIGAMVNAIQNEVTGDVVDVMVHPWLPQGNMPIVSWTLPLPDSNVSDVFSVYNVSDYQMIEWPVNQLSFDVSSWWYGTFVCYAPAWCGAITGITKV